MWFGFGDINQSAKSQSTACRARALTEPLSPVTALKGHPRQQPPGVDTGVTITGRKSALRNVAVRSSAADVTAAATLRALVYDILPSTTAVFGYAVGSRKLSANEQFFCRCSNGSKFVTNNSNKTRRVIYSRQ